MKVLHIFNEINFSGAEVMYAKAASLFQQNGIKMYTFSICPDKEEIADAIDSLLNDNAKYEKLSANRLDFVKTNFGDIDIAKEYLNILSTIK